MKQESARQRVEFGEEACGVVKGEKVVRKVTGRYGKGEGMVICEWRACDRKWQAECAARNGRGSVRKEMGVRVGDEDLKGVACVKHCKRASKNMY